ncbi:HSP-70 cofactor [Rickettsiales bacterium Ac37b]|nr:HSP-70 cofactor [Rickettsiales bacterium Ac37b]
MESKNDDEMPNNELNETKILEENPKSAESKNGEFSENIKQQDQEVIQNFEKEITLLKDQLLRAVAETENVRRRAEKQYEEASKFAITNFARDLINVMENLYRATEFASSSDVAFTPELKAVIEGVEITQKEFISVFEKHGLKRIVPARGEKFDHNIHQAVAHVEDQELESGLVTQIMQAGYTLKDRLLRPAMVAVSK